MSQDAAQTTTPYDPERGSDRHPNGPRPPSFTAGLDRRLGVVRVRGHLDALAAELLRASVVALRECGHRVITVRLRPLATADAAALEVLAGLADSLAPGGVRLVVE